ncbi:MAG: dynactin subunit [Lasallia pustulata]|uniref:Dynactin subunit n=1 Tax=Lasallia pustulata TaxID=136370 RepID=A0A5M8Q3R4_9LECA|nr:MAG: dynactin subunit [Lasallia pustulata]
MSDHRKYAGLPDLDLAPDIYETPDLTDDTSTHPASTVFRSDSRASLDRGYEDDEDTGIDRHRLDPDEARSHFLPAQLSAREVDFSDRISSKRKSYRASSRRRRKGENGVEELGDLSDDDDEGFERKLARLRREVEELKEASSRRRAEKTSVDETETPDDGRREPDNGLDDLSNVLHNLHTASGSGGVGGAGSRLAKKLNGAMRAPTVSIPNGSAAEPDQHPPGSSTYTVTYAPTYAKDQALARAADFDTRLTLIETVLGVDSIPLSSEGRATSKAVLPMLDTLDRQLSTISTTSVTSLDSIGQRIRQLTQDAEKLEEARKAAKAAHEALRSSQRDSNASQTVNGEVTAANSIEDPEQVSKINALYGTLATIESLSPLLSSVLDRLRSLRTIHAEAATASESLARVEQTQEEMTGEIKSWKEGLEKVEHVMRHGEETMGGNMNAMEGWIKQLEERMSKLAS